RRGWRGSHDVIWPAAGKLQSPCSSYEGDGPKAACLGPVLEQVPTTKTRLPAQVQEVNEIDNTRSSERHYPGSREAIREAYLTNGNVPSGAVDTMISSLSPSTLKQYGQNDVGSHPLVKRFVRGVFRLRPPRPKYTSTWDPGAVLDFVKSSNESSFKDTSAHLVTLMALATGQRLQTLSLIRLPNIQQETGGVRIFIPDLIKTSRPNAEQPTLWFPFFGKEPSLCVASRILQYLSTSKQFRGSRHDTFLISTTKPFGPASSQTLSRWIRQTKHVELSGQ
ncbi:unnamed protein product, partial [Nesidiocoris tenuis]